MNDLIASTLHNVLANITGRSADVSPDYINTRTVAELAMLAGGDVLEIGSFFGASAITIAKLIPGKVYCIDPLDGRKQMKGKQEIGRKLDALSGATMGPDVFRANCARNGVHNVILVPKLSYPIPREIEGRAFGLIFIDGDHWHGQPMQDWMNYHYRSSRFVVFDDADEAHPDVIDAALKASFANGWNQYLRKGTLCVVERDHG